MGGTHNVSNATAVFASAHKMGIDINQEIFENRAHNDYDGIFVGVNELGVQFINNTYKETIKQVKKYE